MYVEFILVNDFPAMMQDLILRIKTVSSPYVITSRLDNDDVISNIFIQTIQDAFQPQDKLIINLNSGYDYHSQLRLLTKWNKRFRNHFMSLIEERTSRTIYSVYGFPHWKPPVEATLFNCEGPPYWIYWRHGENYSTQEKRGIPQLRKPDMSSFPEAVHVSISRKNTLRYVIEWLPKVMKRKFRKWLRMGVIES